MVSQSRNTRMAQYCGGLALALVLIGVTVARADDDSCAQCVAYWTSWAGQPGRPCYQNMSRVCLNPYLKANCWDTGYCPGSSLSDAECKGINAEYGIVCPRNVQGPCTWDSWNRSCGSGTQCNDTAVQNDPNQASVCYVDCLCVTPP